MEAGQKQWAFSFAKSDGTGLSFESGTGDLPSQFATPINLGGTRYYVSYATTPQKRLTFQPTAKSGTYTLDQQYRWTLDQTGTDTWEVSIVRTSDNGEIFRKLLTGSPNILEPIAHGSLLYRMDFSQSPAQGATLPTVVSVANGGTMPDGVSRPYEITTAEIGANYVRFNVSGGMNGQDEKYSSWLDTSRGLAIYVDGVMRGTVYNGNSFRLNYTANLGEADIQVRAILYDDSTGNNIYDDQYVSEPLRVEMGQTQNEKLNLT